MFILLNKIHDYLWHTQAKKEVSIEYLITSLRDSFITTIGINKLTQQQQYQLIAMAIELEFQPNEEHIEKHAKKVLEIINTPKNQTTHISIESAQKLIRNLRSIHNGLAKINTKSMSFFDSKPDSIGMLFEKIIQPKTPCYTKLIQLLQDLFDAAANPKDDGIQTILGALQTYKLDANLPFRKEIFTIPASFTNADQINSMTALELAQKAGHKEAIQLLTKLKQRKS